MKRIISGRIKLCAAAVALGGISLLSVGCSGDSTTVVPSTPKVSSVVFTNTSAAKTDIERSTVYTRSLAVVTFADGSSRTYPLNYTTLFHSSDQINGVIPGGVVDYKGAAIMDTSVAGPANQLISDAPDANSLLRVDGATATGLGGNPLFLATQYEYVTADNSGSSRYGLLPMGMSLATLDQNKTDGSLRVSGMKQIDFSAVGGLWIPCAGSLSPWNTHLGSEEYEPDARSFEAGLNNLSGQPILTSMTLYYSDLLLTPSPYNYGISPEVTILPDGSTSVVKHYSLGRIALELVQVMPDNRTVYMGDDGDYTGLFMYVADREKDLSAGTLYAGRWNQTSGVGAGAANLAWIKLGHATDAEARAMTILKFSDIFETGTSTTSNDGLTPNYFTRIKVNNNSVAIKDEYLRVKPGREKAAAFLETRRYAAYLGATVEFNKMEGVTVNARDNKAYIAMSRIEKGMTDIASDPTNDIKLTKLTAGAVYELALTGSQIDTTSTVINSQYVAASMTGLLAGEDIAADAVGNRANIDKISNPDNIKYSETMRTLFIGEDSGQHINNYLWAYNIDTKKLSRILSLPAGAESTGLQVVENLNGFPYIMSNFQHPADLGGYASLPADLRSRLLQLMLTSGLAVTTPVTATTPYGVRPAKGAVGYLGGLPALQ